MACAQFTVKRRRNLCSDVEIIVSQAVNMILLDFVKSSGMYSVAWGQFSSDLSLIIDLKLASCALIFAFTPVLAAAV